MSSVSPDSSSSVPLTGMSLGALPSSSGAGSPPPTPPKPLSFKAKDINDMVGLCQEEFEAMADKKGYDKAVKEMRESKANQVESAWRLLGFVALIAAIVGIVALMIIMQGGSITSFVSLFTHSFTTFPLMVLATSMATIGLPFIIIDRILRGKDAERDMNMYDDKDIDYQQKVTKDEDYQKFVANLAKKYDWQQENYNFFKKLYKTPMTDDDKRQKIRLLILEKETYKLWKDTRQFQKAEQEYDKYTSGLAKIQAAVDAGKDAKEIFELTEENNRHLHSACEMLRIQAVDAIDVPGRLKAERSLLSIREQHIFNFYKLESLTAAEKAQRLLDEKELKAEMDKKRRGSEVEMKEMDDKGVGDPGDAKLEAEKQARKEADKKRKTK